MVLQISCASMNQGEQYISLACASPKLSENSSAPGSGYRSVGVLESASSPTLRMVSGACAVELDKDSEFLETKVVRAPVQDADST